LLYFASFGSVFALFASVIAGTLWVLTKFIQAWSRFFHALIYPPEALGFKILLDGDVTIFGVGDSAFILQRYYKKEWAENCMMQMMVDDLDAWWKRIETLNLPKSFGVRPPKPPAIQPWGLRVGYVWDPSGVLWHVAQRRKNTPAD
jgi:hypothetical protein